MNATILDMNANVHVKRSSGYDELLSELCIMTCRDGQVKTGLCHVYNDRRT